MVSRHRASARSLETTGSDASHHLARLEAGQEKGDFQALALAFYTDGTQYKVYTVSDLVQHPERMRESVLPFPVAAQQQL